MNKAMIAAGVFLFLSIMIGGTVVSAKAQFIANTRSAGIKSITDPNYNTYQNLGLGFSIKYLKNMTVSKQKIMDLKIV